MVPAKKTRPKTPWDHREKNSLNSLRVKNSKHTVRTYICTLLIYCTLQYFHVEFEYDEYVSQLGNVSELVELGG